MQMRSLMAVAVAASGLLIAGQTFAASPFHAEAKLVTPVTTPATATAADANWRCDGAVCVGEAEHRASLDNPVRECRKVAAVLGPLAGYTTRGQTLEGGDLKACNTAAAKSTVATTAR